MFPANATQVGCSAASPLSLEPEYRSPGTAEQTAATFLPGLWKQDGQGITVQLLHRFSFNVLDNWQINLSAVLCVVLHYVFLDVFCLWEISKCQPLFLLKVFNDIAF